MLKVQKVTDIRNIPWEFLLWVSLSVWEDGVIYLSERGGTVKDGTVKY